MIAWVLARPIRMMALGGLTGLSELGALYMIRGIGMTGGLLQ